jgi:hypothetical protein
MSGEATNSDLQTLRPEAKAWNRRMNRDRIQDRVEVRSQNCSPQVLIAVCGWMNQQHLQLID